MDIGGAFNIGGMIDAPMEAFGLDLNSVPIVGGLFTSDEEKQANARFGQVADRYRQLKPEVAQSYSNALRTQLGAFQPSNNMIGAMAGGDPNMMLDMNALSRSPVTPGMMQTPQTGIPGANDPKYTSGKMGLPDGIGLAGAYTAPYEFLGGLF